jgi:hypothetical protein
VALVGAGERSRASIARRITHPNAPTDEVGAFVFRPLPRLHSSRFLYDVSASSIFPSSTSPRRDSPRREPSVAGRGIAAGLIAAAAVLGLLIGIGRRAGTALRPLNATAYTLLGTRADGVWGFDIVVTLVGVLVVLAVGALAGWLVARLSPPFRTFRVLFAAAGVALLGYLLHVHLAARVDGGLSALLTIGELRALYAVGAGALVLGMRFAFSPGASAVRD